MPDYLYPGVYVEEQPIGNAPIEGVSTSTVGFLGVAQRGPVIPTFIDSYNLYVQTFGGPVLKADGTPVSYLPYAVEGFFQNQGQICYVSRVVSSTAVTASASTADIAVAAIGPGAWGSQVGFLIEPAGLNNAFLFKLSVFYWSLSTAAAKAKGLKTSAAVLAAATPPDTVETYDNLSFDNTDSTYYVPMITGASALVAVSSKSTAKPSTPNGLVLLDSVKGTDGSALVLADFIGNSNDPENPTGLTGLGANDDISILCCPDENSIPNNAVAQQLQIQCETLKDRFAILQSAAGGVSPTKVVPSVISQYCAFYYPWVYITDPVTDNQILIPPGGHIAGIYARSDTNRNVAKDPANEPILGIDSIQLKIDNQTQGVLNPIGVNALRNFKGRGDLVWGGRTTASDPDWKYISVRRLFIFVEKSLQQGTQWVVFEPNDDPTWARVRQSVSDFLTGLWLDDMLVGVKKEQAFFVRCDRTTMTQTDIDNGRLIMLIGIAPVKPAEFVIFRIGQWTAGSDAPAT